MVCTYSNDAAVVLAIQIKLSAVVTDDIVRLILRRHSVFLYLSGALALLVGVQPKSMLFLTIQDNVVYSGLQRRLGPLPAVVLFPRLWDYGGTGWLADHLVAVVVSSSMPQISSGREAFPLVYLTCVALAYTSASSKPASS